MPVDLTSLIADLCEETADVDRMLGSITEAQWGRPTPAEGWLIRDQISHLAYFDDMTVLAITDPDRFAEHLRDADNSGADLTDHLAQRHRDLPVGDLQAWFTRSRETLLRVAADRDPSARVPWYGPPMSLASSLTARIMETWAHGQDIADALDVTREPSARLRHVAHIGVGARAYSFQVRNLAVPTVPIRVDLLAPDGSRWAWGPEDAADRIAGDALDFALVVTQRRHRDDTGLALTGDVATSWMQVAQAFAGPAGPGRPPTPAGRT